MSSERRPLIAGNWKMNGLTADGLALARAVAGECGGARGPARPEVLLCPPATLIARVAEAVAGSGLAVGGQDCHAEPKGAHTGDVSAEMLADLGCRYVIVGHSERRRDHGESDAAVRAKAEAAVRAGLVPIVCIGETEAEYLAGHTADVLRRQIRDSVPAAATPATLVVAYEPVWAIGTGRTPGLDEIAAMHALIRETLSARGIAADGVRLLYGGSMKPANAADILAIADVDGGLVGGASLSAEDFCAIVRRCP